MTKRNLKTLTTTIAVAASLIGMSSMLAAQDRPAMLAPLGHPTSPSDNPTTPAKVELGKMLFFDGRLSGNGSMPCSCLLYTSDAADDDYTV